MLADLCDYIEKQEQVPRVLPNPDLVTGIMRAIAQAAFDSCACSKEFSLTGESDRV